MNLFPEQRISYKAKDYKWSKQCTDSLIDSCMNITQQKKDILRLKRVAKGELDPRDYADTLNPYNFPEAELKNLPGVLRNIDIIKPVLRRYLGEFIKSYRNPTVVVHNSDSKQKFTEALNEQYWAYMAQMLSNELANAGLTNKPSQELPTPDEALKQFKTNWHDTAAIIGQESLDYLRENLRLFYKEADMFYEFLVTDTVFTFKDVLNDDVHYEVVPSEQLYYINNGTEFVEDFDAVVRVRTLSYNQIVDLFRDKFSNTKEAFEYFKKNDTLYGQSIVGETGTALVEVNDVSLDTITETLSSEFDNNDNGITEFHCMWKSQKKVGLLTYLNEVGMESTMEVDEDYKINKDAGDISIKWEWINEVWHSRAFGEKGTRIYVDAEPIMIQREQVNNRSKCKLLYNGKLGYLRDGGNNSVVNILAPYQAIINILYLQRDRAIARSKGTIITFPKGLIPDDDEMNFDEALYYAAADGLLFFDETKPNAAAAMQGIKGIDTSNAVYIKELTAIINDTKEAAWDAVDMNRQRYGDTYASDGKANTEQAILRSSTGSIPLVEAFNNFLESEYQGLLDVSKYAWLNEDGTKIKGSYVTSDGRNVWFTVNGVDHLSNDYGVFVRNSSIENQKLKDARSLAFSMAQNGNNEMALAAIDSNNFAKLKSIIGKYSEAERQLKAAMEKERNESMERMKQAELADKQAERDIQTYKIDKAYQAAVDVAMINSSKDTMGVDANTNMVDDSKEIEVNQLKREAKRDELLSTELKTTQEMMNKNVDVKLKMKELDIKEKEIASKERIAVKNKNRYDK